MVDHIINYEGTVAHRKDRVRRRIGEDRCLGSIVWLASAIILRYNRSTVAAGVWLPDLSVQSIGEEPDPGTLTLDIWSLSMMNLAAN